MTSWVLVLDDDKDNRELFAELIEYAGYAVECCGSAAGAQAILDVRGKPGLVLADVMLPDMTGPEFVTSMRKRPGFEETPVIFVSGFQAAALGQIQAPVLTKPVNVDVLLALVARHCDRVGDAVS